MITGPAETPSYQPPTEFSVGRTLGDALTVLSQHFVPFIAIAALAGLPSLAYRQLEHTRSGASAWILILLNLVVESLCEAMILYGTFQALRGRPVRIGESIGVGLRYTIPVVIASLAIGVVTGIGFILLIVPGLIALTMFFVTEPAIVVERLGPFDGMGRSIDLTRGYRWPIFGLVFVVTIVSIVVGAIIGATLLHPETLLWYSIAVFVWEALARAYQSVLVAIVYHDLRVLKEGIDLDRIASVFD
jgi:hypothetical protein